MTTVIAEEKTSFLFKQAGFGHFFIYMFQVFEDINCLDAKRFALENSEYRF